jgi:predicted TIM-barrel fold metal-dependent hydrolase
MRIAATFLCAAMILAPTWCLCRSFAQETKEDIRQLKLKDWKPRSMLKVKETKVDKPAFPAIDVHNHLGGGKQTLTAERVAGYLTEMNEAGVRTVVNLDGGWGERLKETIAALDEAHPDRFLTFAQIDFSGIDNADWGERETKRLEESFKAGAMGLKFHKSLGLSYRYKNGELMKVDDHKLSGVFEMCAKYQRPVMLHTADPAAFFTPLDQFNERWHELNTHPDWLFYGEKFPSREELLKQFTSVLARHPKTTFIGAHFGNNVEDLAMVSEWLDAYPNLHVDIDARISELGRQPYTARKFLMKYQDRIMFGTDTTPRREAFRIYYRFLETDDEYFDCAESHHLQGFWMIYGVFLPKEVLEKIYYKNAEKVLLAAPRGRIPAVDAPKNTAIEPLKWSLVHWIDPAKEVGPPEYRLQAVDDFELTGNGDRPQWSKAKWANLTPQGRPDAYASRFKAVYSQKGVYVLFDGEDERVSATMNEDNLDLWREDCFELFLMPDESRATYFEYEISPLGKELPLLIMNHTKKDGWLPWHYEGSRRVQKKVAGRNGDLKSKAASQGWTAEVFIPFELLAGLGSMPPAKGAAWKANFYRMDYDAGAGKGWNWAIVGESFHEYKKFGRLVFE